MTPEDVQAYTAWWNNNAERIAAAFHKLPSREPEHPMSFSALRRNLGNYFMRMYRGPETEGQRNFRGRYEPASLKMTGVELQRL